MLMLPGERELDPGLNKLAGAAHRALYGQCISSVELGTFDLSFAHVRTYARSSQPGDRSSRA